MTLKSVTLAVTLALLNTSLHATDTDKNIKESKDNIEVLVIRAPAQNASNTSFAEGNFIQPDVADWLKTVPGAATNKNGPITGIAQYRGLYGDRVNKNIDNHTIIGAGPNAMDSPLSYVSPIMVDSVFIYRGVAPISSGIDTFAGSIKVNLKKADISENFNASGDLITNYSSLDDATTAAASLNLSGHNFGFMAYGSSQTADDYKDANGNQIITSEYDKQQYGIDLRYGYQSGNIGLSWHHSRTVDSGTPALPMDIIYIDADRFALEGIHQFNRWQFDWSLGYLDNAHGMDNYSYRTNPMPAMHRYTTALGNSYDYKLMLSNNAFKFGFEGVAADHSVMITNPNNAMFSIDNFNDIEDSRHSAFVEYHLEQRNISNTFGLRIKHNTADAGKVMHSMAMMNPNIAALRNQFNSTNKKVSDTTYDLAWIANYKLSNTLSYQFGLGSKQRAASYQERYLWIPMQATAGLADGRTYLGNINLKPETNQQISLGFTYQSKKLNIAPQVFYSKIKDYIQGTPSTNMQANMIAMMMTGMKPLQFSNIDAKIYGMDMNWSYKINKNWNLQGIASYVRGERQDIQDNLYRISPLNAQFALAYSGENWSAQLISELYSKQKHVSAINNEKATAGYGLLHWKMDYHFNNGLTLRAGVNNLLDKQYSNHLNGINRARGSQIPQGAKLPGRGRDLFLALEYAF